MSKNRTFVILGLALLLVAILLFTPLTPFTQAQTVAEFTTMPRAADRINARAAEGFSVHSQTQQQGYLVIVFTRQVPWYNRLDILASPPSPTPTPLPTRIPEPTTAPAAPAISSPLR